MKPVSLYMQAFGAYIAPASIDFSLLGDQPFFLISGPTGGGKTTILDAMCFALYCQATGGRRSFSDMRSALAPDASPTRVEFVFWLGGERYRFCRELSVHIVRGKGRRELRDSHAYYRWKEEAWALQESGSEEKIRKAAQQLLGMTREQFAQIMVLPQGEFLKLLRSSTRDKGKILETLFDTQCWKQAAEVCKQQADRLFRQVEGFHLQMRSLLEREELEDAASLGQKQGALREEMQRLQQEEQKLGQQWNLARKALQEGKELWQWDAEYRKWQEEKARLEGKAQEMAALRHSLQTASRLREIWPYRQAFQAARTVLEEKIQAEQKACQRREKTAERWEQAQQEKEQIPFYQQQERDAEKRSEQLAACREKSARLQELEREQAGFTQQKNDCCAKLEQNQAALDRIGQSLETGKGYIRQAELAAQELPQIQETLRQWQTRLENLETLGRLETQEQEAARERDRTKREWEAADLSQEALREKLQREETLWQQNQAVFLAGSLQEGQACPVCGSLHHPFPAKPSGGQGGTQGQLAKLRESVREGDGRLQARTQEYQKAQALWEQKEAAVLEQRQLCEGVSMEEARQNTGQWQKEAAEKEKQANSLPRARERLAKLEQDKEAAEKERESLRENLAQAEMGWQKCEAARTELLRGMDEAMDLEEAETQWKALQEQIAGWKRKYEEAQSRFSSAQEDWAACQTEYAVAKQMRQEAEQKACQARQVWEEKQEQAGLTEEENLEALYRTEAEIQEAEMLLRVYEKDRQQVQAELSRCEENLAGNPLPDLDLLEQAHRQAERQYHDLRERMGALAEKMDSLIKSRQQWEQWEQQCKEAETAYSRAGRVAERLRGKNPKKVTLDAFVLGIMLDDILSSANQFFSQMSRGRYSLYRRLERSAGNAQGGLDLEVLDAGLGASRSIETLSGGEQFLASLSLAFGLSDVVQQYSGGVRLDSIFIDEGFGSLDQETLDMAMKALEAIHRTGRTIGIISHISELKSRIRARIEVLPTAANGSAAVKVIGG